MTAIEALLRLSFAFTLGGFTFLAPCAFPLLPGYLAFFLGTEDETLPDGRTRLARGAVVGGVVSAGFFAVYVSLGVVVAVVGTRLLGNISLLELVVGLLLIVLGTAMAAGYNPVVRVPLPERRRSLGGYFGFGVVYAAAAAGCTAPLFIFAVGASLTADPLLGVGVLVAYAAGMSVVMVAVTGAVALGRQPLLRVVSGRLGHVERVAGVLLVLAGIAQIVLYLFWFDGLRQLGLA